MLDDLKVLVLEDNAVQRLMLCSILRAIGIETIAEVDDGTRALSYLDECDEGSAPDVIITDLEMEGMDGIRFTRHLADMDLDASLIISSAHDPAVIDSVVMMVRLLNIPFLGVLPKPYHKNDVKDLLLSNPSVRAEMAVQQSVQNQTGPQITEDDIRDAMENGEIVPFYQPKVNTRTFELEGFEVLARWNSPKFGHVPPDSFIPICEQSHLVDKLTHVLARSVSQRMRDLALGPGTTISINVSVRTLMKSGASEILKDVFISEKMPTNRVIIEVTENAINKDPINVLENLARLRIAGFGISIDDFGTGHSSLSRLATAPFNELKIDRMFVSGSLSTSQNAVFETSVDLGIRLNMKTVGEGVETAEDLQRLSDSGCTIAQGYYIGRPMAGEGISEWMDEWAGRRLELQSLFTDSDEN